MFAVAQSASPPRVNVTVTGATATPLLTQITADNLARRNPCNGLTARAAHANFDRKGTSA